MSSALGNLKFQCKRWIPYVGLPTQEVWQNYLISWILNNAFRWPVPTFGRIVPLPNETHNKNQLQAFHAIFLDQMTSLHLEPNLLELLASALPRVQCSDIMNQDSQLGNYVFPTAEGNFQYRQIDWISVNSFHQGKQSSISPILIASIRPIRHWQCNCCSPSQWYVDAPFGQFSGPRNRFFTGKPDRKSACRLLRCTSLNLMSSIALVEHIDHLRHNCNWGMWEL